MKRDSIWAIGIVSVLTAALFLEACNNDDGSMSDTPVDVLDGEPTVRCPTAWLLELAGPGAEGRIDVPGKSEFYTVIIDAPGFVRFTTQSDSVLDDDGGPFDPVLSIYTADGAKLIATADNLVLDELRAANRTLDAEALYHVTEATTLCIQVEDHSTWADEQAPRGNENFVYTINAARAENVDAIDIEEGEIDTIATAQMLGPMPGAAIAADLGVVCGTIDSVSDVDVFAIDNSFGGTLSVSGWIQPASSGNAGAVPTAGTGSTLSAVRLTRLHDNGSRFSSVLLSESGWLESPATVSTVYLSVELEEGASLGANDFYCVHYELQPAENVWDTNEANAFTDDLTTALELGNLTDTGFTRVRGTLSDGLDVDYYSFEVPAPGTELELACGAATVGSGLLRATFVIQDSIGATLHSEIESGDWVVWGDSAGASRGPLILEQAGTHYLVVLHYGQHAEIIGAHYSCQIELF